MKIGILEDNDSIREVLKRYLELEGWSVTEFPKVKPLMDYLSQRKDAPGLDLLIMDIMLPDGDGFLTARQIQDRWPKLPFLFLTARTEESDRITGLELGAEDYVVKPFSNREVVLRVRSLFRRLGIEKQPSVPSLNAWSLGEFLLEQDETSLEARINGVKLNLTAAEWSILGYLSSRSPQVLSRGQILEHCLQSVVKESERTVDTHIKNLRHKLGSEEWIETVRRFGYRFCGRKA